MSAHTQSGLPENVAALLSYVLGWITGLVFLLIDKRPYVRFHAAQSVVVFLGLHVLRGVLGLIFGMGWWFGGAGYWGAFTLGALLVNLFSLLSLVLWICPNGQSIPRRTFQATGGWRDRREPRWPNRLSFRSQGKYAKLQ